MIRLQYGKKRGSDVYVSKQQVSIPTIKHHDIFTRNVAGWYGWRSNTFQQVEGINVVEELVHYMHIHI